MSIATASADMHAAVFGGSGATGKALLARLAREGVPVRALARKAGLIVAPAGQVEVVEGALSDTGDVQATLHGCGAAVCVFGPRPPYVDVFCEQATANIVLERGRVNCRS